MVKTADQVAELAFDNGLQVSESIAASLLPTPTAVDFNTIAQSELDANDPKHRLKVASQVLARDNGLKVSESIAASLLPTPAVGHIRNHDEPIEDYLERRQDYIDGKTKGMPGASLGVAVRMEMLPTVTTQDAKNNAGKSQFERNTLPLNAEVTLLDTPRATASDSSAAQVELDAPKSRIEDQVLITNWGKFEPAIRRWESITRPALAPTKPDGKDGNHRLSAEFTEWMMGLPAGWITDPEIGLTRNEQLKACGNGVVPQQAELALRILLTGINIEGNK